MTNLKCKACFVIAAKDLLLNLEAVSVPTSVTFESLYETDSVCLTAVYDHNGDILMGTTDGIELLSRETMDTTSLFDEDSSWVESVVKHDDNIYMLKASEEKSAVEAHVYESGKCVKELLFELPGMDADSDFGTITVSKDYVATALSNTKVLYLYDLESKQTTTLSPFPSVTIHFALDGCLLAVNEDVTGLIKYKIENGKLIQMWETDNHFEYINAVCTDSYGLIYAFTAPLFNLPDLDVFSPQGM